MSTERRDRLAEEYEKAPSQHGFSAYRAIGFKAGWDAHAAEQAQLSSQHLDSSTQHLPASSQHLERASQIRASVFEAAYNSEIKRWPIALLAFEMERQVAAALADERERALEEAAQLCGRERVRKWTPKECAKQIRALKGTPRG